MPVRPSLTLIPPHVPVPWTLRRLSASELEDTQRSVRNYLSNAGNPASLTGFHDGNYSYYTFGEIEPLVNTEVSIRLSMEFQLVRGLKSEGRKLA